MDRNSGITSQVKKNQKSKQKWYSLFWGGGGVVAARRLSLVGENEGFSLAAVRGLLIAVASLVVEYRL